LDSEQPKKRRAGRKGDRLSLSPLTFDEAVAELMDSPQAAVRAAIAAEWKERGP